MTSSRVHSTLVHPLVVPSLLSVLLLAGCEHAEPLEPIPQEPLFSNIEQDIFALNCALSGCHAGSNPQQGMNLSPGQAYENIVNVASRERPDLLRIDPGNPEDSYLLKKIRGDSDIVGSRMPLGRAPLSSEEIDLIRTWIEEGAQRD